MIILIVWLISSLIAFLSAIYWLRELDITIKDCIFVFIITILGPIAIMFLISYYYDKYKDIVVIKRKK